MSGNRRALPQLRELVADVKRLGERGLTITRFKGLGEMDPEELWETTLDPAKRTLLRFNLDDALKADEGRRGDRQGPSGCTRGGRLVQQRCRTA